jgi:multiple sugar transport system substrate-binding protein
MTVKWFGRVGILICVVSVALAALWGCSDNKIPSLRIALVDGPEGAAIKSVYAGYKGARIEIVELPYSGLREQLVSTLSSAETAFDVVMIDDPWFPQLSGGLLELQNLPQSLIDDIIDKSLALGREPYGTGIIKALPFVGNTQLLFFRPDLLKEHGIKGPPETWNDVVQVARKLVAADNRRYGYATRARSGAPIVTDFLPIYWSFGGRLTDNVNGQLLNKLDKPTFKEALTIYRELLLASPPGAINFDFTEITAAFTQGAAAMELSWPAAIPEIEMNLPDTAAGPRWAVAPPPGKTGPGTSMIGNWLLGIPLASRNQKAALDFILWLMDQQIRTADAGRPPTRKSVFDTISQTKPYFSTIRKALEGSTPRDRTPKWALIEDAVSRAVSTYLADPSRQDEVTNSLSDELNRLAK